MWCPSYVAPSYGQWVPGYWSYVWVPQAATTSAWVPGYYDRDGVWVAGYHSAQAVPGRVLSAVLGERVLESLSRAGRSSARSLPYPAVHEEAP